MASLTFVVLFLVRVQKSLFFSTLQQMLLPFLWFPMLILTRPSRSVISIAILLSVLLKVAAFHTSQTTISITTVSHSRQEHKLQHNFAMIEEHLHDAVRRFCSNLTVSRRVSRRNQLSIVCKISNLFHSILQVASTPHVLVRRRPRRPWWFSWW